MMKYEIFKELVIGRFKDYLSEKYQDMDMKIISVNKVNRVKEAINLIDNSEEIKLCPNIYIDDMYAQYWPCVDGGFKPAISTDPVLIEYKSFIIQEKAKIITGEKPVEYWDEVLQGYYDAGYATYVEQMLEYINN